MAYELHPLAPHILRLEFSGEVTEADTERYRVEVAPYLSQVTPQDPLHFLIYARNVSRVSSKARQFFTELNKDPKFGKLAVLGLNRALKVLAVFMSKASGRHNIRIFDDEAQALAWLQER
jgi:hypothetical protein